MRRRKAVIRPYERLSRFAAAGSRATALRSQNSNSVCELGIALESIEIRDHRASRLFVTEFGYANDPILAGFVFIGEEAIVPSKTFGGSQVATFG